MTVNETAPAPVPRIAFCLSIGVTGHRALNGADAALRATLASILKDLRDAAVRLHAAEPDAFAATALPPRLVCGLAEGADQLAAEVALGLGYELHAALPFARGDYAADFAGTALAAFEGLLARAARVFELPCTRDEPAAYGLAGRATVAHCDVLIAVWDGLPARGPGGTAEVVEFAARRGVPVIHVAADGGGARRLIWSVQNPHLTVSRLEDFTNREIGGESIDLVLRERLAPPPERQERAHLATFYGEREHRARLRLEYPLLLALAGVQRLRQGVVWVARDRPGAAGEWASFRAAAGQLVAGALPLEGIERSYAWSDRLAAYYAQMYRSGHVFNFVVGAAAVLIGLTGLMVPGVKLWLAITELAAIGLVVINTRIAVTRNWHRRWLDYRQLAERLRPMRSLVLLGLAQPGEGGPRGSRRWVDWYAAGVWRAAGLPAGRLTGGAPALAALVLAEEIAPQIAYHRSSAHRIAHLDHRLHAAGSLVFILSCVSSAAFILLYLVAHEWLIGHAAAFVAVSAGLPAVATALFGIRVQGDFAGTAARSRVTADHLETIAMSLRDPGGLSRVADEAEAAARAMLADLGEWRLSHQQRQLEVG